MANKHRYFIDSSNVSNFDLFSKDLATYMDEHDSLRSFRNKFYFPKCVNDKEPLYFNGNSLGLMPKDSTVGVNEQLEKWKNLASHGHHNEPLPWLSCDEYLTDDMADIVGAKKNEIALMNQLSVNLHLMLVSFYRPTKERYKILCECNPFPSDRFAFESQIEWHGFDPNTSLITIKPRTDEFYLHTEDIIKVIEENADQIALICLSGVQYLTGQFFDIQKITETGKNRGCVIGWDMAHAVGNLPLRLHDWGVDFAVWCSYKYLNSGPGGLGGVFVHENHLKNENLFFFRGWWGLKLSERLEMPNEFIAEESALKFRISNTPFTSCVLLQTSLKLFKEAGIENLRQKSIVLTNYLEYLILNKLDSEVFKIITPENENERGSQLSLKFNGDMEELQTILKENNIFCDFRKQCILRLAPCAIYNSFRDVFNIIETLIHLNKKSQNKKEIVNEKN